MKRSTANCEVFAGQADVLGESPVWSAPLRALYWLDIGRKRLYRKSLSGELARWELGGRPGCIERLEEGLAVTFGDGVHRLDVASGECSLLYRVPLAAGVRFNEGKADPRGRLWFGSMQDNFGPDGEAVLIERFEGKLFRWDAGGALTVMEEDVGIANTLAWSPDETSLYFADSLLDRICVYDYDACTGNVANKRLFFAGANQGLPDGSAIDTDGCLWNTRWGAGVILRITPMGKIDRCVELPVLQPSSCAFGGPRLDTLFVTSARNGLSATELARSPLSGSVLAIAGLAQGLPVPSLQWRGSHEPGRTPLA